MMRLTTHHGAVASPASGDNSRPCADDRPRQTVERSSSVRSREQGYVLLSLLLIFALSIIFAAAAASSIAFKIRRDREEELLHRGAEYSRAIRRFTKKMGRYPLRVEDLENTDHQRFLRKRYKDPITGKDFKLLHLTDLQRIGIGGLGTNIAAQPNAAAVMGSSTTGANMAGANPFAAGSGISGQTGAPSADPSAAQPADAATEDQNSSVAAGQGASGHGASGQSGFGQNAPTNPVAPGNDANAPNSPFSGQQPIGGGVIVGVASASKDKTIREFSHKNHYNDWLFFYDPAYDRGYEIKGPTQLTMPTSNLNPGQPAAANPTQH